MANFLPFRNYLFCCLEKMIRQYDLKPPFLDVGCGQGDFSRSLGLKGWKGKAMDMSAGAVEKAKEKLRDIPSVEIELGSFGDETAKYRSIFLLDALEHMSEDREVLKKLASLLEPDGRLILAVPSNPRWWGWDDDAYGHLRRYTFRGLEGKLRDAGLRVIVAWDFTYPFFWMLRQLYLGLNPRKTYDKNESALDRTKRSGLPPEWQRSRWVNFFAKLSCIWRPFYYMMFTFFRFKIRQGHEMIVLACPLTYTRS